MDSLHSMQLGSTSRDKQVAIQQAARQLATCTLLPGRPMPPLVAWVGPDPAAPSIGAEAMSGAATFTALPALETADCAPEGPAASGAATVGFMLLAAVMLLASGGEVRRSSSEATRT
jgi:hypothetical protein